MSLSLSFPLFLHEYLTLYFVCVCVCVCVCVLTDYASWVLIDPSGVASECFGDLKTAKFELNTLILSALEHTLYLPHNALHIYIAVFWQNS